MTCVRHLHRCLHQLDRLGTVQAVLTPLAAQGIDLMPDLVEATDLVRAGQLGPAP